MKRLYTAALALLLTIVAAPHARATLLTSATGNMDDNNDRIVGILDNGVDLIRVVYDNYVSGGDENAFLNNGVDFGVTGELSWRSRDNTAVGESWSVDLRVEPSPGAVSFVFNSGSTAGNNDSSLFTLDWGDAGSAIIDDPASELTVESNGGGSVSFRLSSLIGFRSNNQTQWSVTTPGIDAVTISWQEIPDNNGTQQERLALAGFSVEFPDTPGVAGSAVAPEPTSLAGAIVIACVARKTRRRPRRRRVR